MAVSKFVAEQIALADLARALQRPKAPAPPTPARFGSPFPFTLDAINERVDETPGVYKLLGPRGKVYRIGRSFKSLKRRLKEYLTQRQYKKDMRYAAVAQIQVAYLDTKRDVFYAECRLFHRYGDPPPLNEKHPDRPTGKTYCCPIDKTCTLGCSDEDD